jgi:hypothetical protein
LRLRRASRRRSIRDPPLVGVEAAPKTVDGSAENPTDP